MFGHTPNTSLFGHAGTSDRCCEINTVREILTTHLDESWTPQNLHLFPVPSLGRLTCVIFSCTQWSRTNCSLDCSTLSISVSSSSLVSWFICIKGNLMGKSKLGHSRETWTKSSSCIPLVTSVKTESNRFCRVSICLVHSERLIH